jgi:peptide/nickel transport system permease protein
LAVEGSIRLGYAIFLIASLGFLGIGVQPPTPDWGVMVADAQDYASQSPWMVIFPALAIASLVIGINLLSDGIKQLVTALEQRGNDVPLPVAPMPSAPVDQVAERVS